MTDLEKQIAAVLPYGYAYRYPGSGGTIRFGTGGREINGSKPIEVIPLYSVEQIRTLIEASEEAATETEHIRCLKVVEQRIGIMSRGPEIWLTSPRKVFSDIALYMLCEVRTGALARVVEAETKQLREALRRIAYAKPGELCDAVDDGCPLCQARAALANSASERKRDAVGG